jgi:gamma-glutamyl-gamma-aminobutyraldehyde dehydrogenase
MSTRPWPRRVRRSRAAGGAGSRRTHGRIRIANDTTYGLAASVFTHDLDAAHRLARAVRAGTVTVNCYGEGDITTPFGGYKGSGFGGKDKGLEAFEQYTEQKTIWIALNSRLGR